MNIPGTIKRESSQLSSSACSECGVECVVGIQVAYRTLKAILNGTSRPEDWRLQRLCRQCAVAIGEIEPSSARPESARECSQLKAANAPETGTNA